MTKPDENVSKFYRDVGWETDGANTEDAVRFEDLRDCAKEYVSKCRLRVLNHIPAKGDYLLDMASGPIQYKEYLEYSKNFKKRYCVDFSSKALSDAECKIGRHGKYCHGDFMDMDFENNFFDCSISLHTIYHIDKDTQESVVRKLLAITKTGAPVIIVYSNPNALISRMGWLKRGVKRLFKFQSSPDSRQDQGEDLYFFSHSLVWWERFRDIADVQMIPWRSFASHHQKELTPDNNFGTGMMSVLYSMENRFPTFFVKNFQYPMIVLRKK